LKSAPVVVLLCGGVGGAKLAEGLAALVDSPVIIGNTGDDLDWYGLHVCPDLDIVMYTLAGVVDPDKGWGLVGDTFHALEMLDRYGQPGWFRLGDRDLVTAILRTMWLRSGATLSEVTARLCRALGVRARLVPMSDDPVRTIVETPDGDLEFQEYFVARGARDEVTRVRLAGVDVATLPPVLPALLDDANLIVIAPSNPIVSIGPILAVPGMRDALRGSPAAVVGVSPLIEGRAIKGPAVAMMRGLGYRPDTVGVAELYRGLLDVFVIDKADAALAPEIRRLGVDVEIRETLMMDAAGKRRLAAELLAIGRVAL